MQDILASFRHYQPGVGDIPTVPPEFLEKLEVSGGTRKGPMFGEADWENEEV